MGSDIPLFFREDFTQLTYEDLIEIAFQMQRFILIQDEMIHEYGKAVDEITELLND